MSGKNGNGRIGKYQKRVAEAAGLKNGDQLPYAPDYFDSLIRRMATPGDWAERTFAWLVYRASGNQSLTAIHLYGRKGEKDKETELRQRDCCLDLAWLEAGYQPEWLDAPLALFRKEAEMRGVEPIDRRYVSDGFTENRERGTVASGSSHRLELIPSPFVIYSPDKNGESKAKQTPYRSFSEEWNVIHSSEYQEEQVARSTYKRIQKVRLSAYKLWLKSQAPAPNGAPSLEALEPLETSTELESRSVSPAFDRPTDPPPTPAEEERPPEPPPEPEAPNSAEEMENLLLQEVGDQFPGEVPGRTLCLQIIQTLADTPWDEFRQKLRSRKWKRDDVLGLTRSLAKEVRDRWIRDADRNGSPPIRQPSCWVCAKPLEGGSVQGAHFACYESARSTG